MDIRPASADPERVRYGFDPVKVIQRRRTEFLMAAFTAMRAFRLAGMPSQGLPAVGSFDDWSPRVRDLVYWLTLTMSARCSAGTKRRTRGGRRTHRYWPLCISTSARSHSRVLR